MNFLPKRSTTSSSVPDVSSLLSGELAVNIEDGIIYIKHPSGTIVNLTGALELHNHSISQITGLQTILDNKLDISGGATGAAIVPSGTEAQRPTGAAGHFRFNSDAGQFEGHDGTDWGGIGGGEFVDGSSTILPISNSDVLPPLVGKYSVGLITEPGQFTAATHHITTTDGWRVNIGIVPDSTFIPIYSQFTDHGTFGNSYRVNPPRFGDNLDLFDDVTNVTFNRRITSATPIPGTTRIFFTLATNTSNPSHMWAVIFDYATGTLGSPVQLLEDHIHDTASVVFTSDNSKFVIVHYSGTSRLGYASGLISGLSITLGNSEGVSNRVLPQQSTGLPTLKRISDDKFVVGRRHGTNTTYIHYLRILSLDSNGEYTLGAELSLTGGLSSVVFADPNNIVSVAAVEDGNTNTLRIYRISISGTTLSLQETFTPESTWVSSNGGFFVAELVEGEYFIAATANNSAAKVAVVHYDGSFLSVVVTQDGYTLPTNTNELTTTTALIRGGNIWGRSARLDDRSFLCVTGSDLRAIRIDGAGNFMYGDGIAGGVFTIPLEGGSIWASVGNNARPVLYDPITNTVSYDMDKSFPHVTNNLPLFFSDNMSTAHVNYESKTYSWDVRFYNLNTSSGDQMVTPNGYMIGKTTSSNNSSGHISGPVS